MGHVLITLLFLLTVTYPMVAIPATGWWQTITLFVVWGVAIGMAALLAHLRDDDDG